MKVALVGCGKSKLEHEAPARDLYTGSLFRAARGWAERNADAWFILSAKHGLVHPDTVIAPYDVTLPDLPKELREEHAAKAAVDFLQAVGPGISGPMKIVILAGDGYTRTGAHLKTLVDCVIELPLAGLGIGRRLAWFQREAILDELYARMRLAELDGESGLAEFTGQECGLLLTAAGRQR